MRKFESFELKELGFQLFIIFIIVLALMGSFAFMISETARHETLIKQWGEEHQYVIQKIERCHLDNGPWLLVDRDSETIYKTFLLDDHEKERISYFKFGIFGMEQRWNE